MTARTLARRVVVRTADASLFEVLRYLDCDPEIPGPTEPDLAIEIINHRHGYLVVEKGEEARIRCSSSEVLEYLHGRMFALSLADGPQVPIVHGASLRAAGRRLLLVGAKGAGKTTLTLRLAGSGYEIEGDENVFVTRDGVIARPRGLRIKEASLALISDIAAVVSTAPSFTDYRGQRIYNLDPRMLGLPWRIERGPADVVIVLRPNHGGYSSLRPLPPLVLIQALMHESGLPAVARGAAVAAMAAVFGSAKGFDLSLGEHDSAMACIGAAMAAS